MPKLPERNLSRRDFLKLAGLGLGVLAISPFNRVLPSRESSRWQNYNPDRVIFNGQTTGIEQLPSDVSNHLNAVLAGIDGGRFLKPNGSRMADLPANYESDWGRATVITDMTTEGTLVTQILVGRKNVKSGWSDLAVTSGLLVAVQGRESQPLWFGERRSSKTELRVDAQRGVVYQITQTGGLLNQVQGTANSITAERLNLTKPTEGFRPVFLPFSQEFMNVMAFLMANLKQMNDAQGKGPEALEMALDSLLPSLVGADSSRRTRVSVFNQGQGLSDWQTQLVDRLDVYASDMPMDVETALVLLKSAGQSLAGGQAGWSQPLSATVAAVETPLLAADTKSEVIRAMQDIVERQVVLPLALPEVFCVPLRRGEKRRLALVAVYAARDDAIRGEGENIYPGSEYITIEVLSGESGEKPESMFPNRLEAVAVPKSVADFITSVSEQVSWSVDTIALAFRVKPEAMRLIYDPGRKAVYAAVSAPHGNENEVFLIRPGNFWGDFATVVSRFNNRFFPFLESNPTGLADVTVDWREMRRQGKTNVSQVAFWPGLEASALIFGFGTEALINYSLELKTFLGTAVGDLPAPVGGKDQAKSQIIAATGAQIVHLYDNSFSNKYEEKGTFALKSCLLFGASAIKEINGKQMIVVAQEGRELFVVAPEQAFFVGATSDIELVAKAAVTILPYVIGGLSAFKVLKAVLPKGFVTSIMKIIGRIMFP
jgi:hypothetical protein